MLSSIEESMMQRVNKFIIGVKIVSIIGNLIQSNFFVFDCDAFFD